VPYRLGDCDEKELDKNLHQLTNSFDPGQSFQNDPQIDRKHPWKHLDECKILDPACGSGAFPMGVLQKMVHILQKLDPDNIIWKEYTKQKAKLKKLKEALRY
jgi:adenine-specific DNA-methyltransferase